ncbi:MAG: L,D-transpeptidase family protein [Betaproteobacteria bacterium]|nr:L,D-transpeptidase family protein [Betaproteobacteria bacterium]
MDKARILADACLAAAVIALIAGLAAPAAAQAPAAVIEEIAAVAAQAQRANLRGAGGRDARSWLDAFYAPAAHGPAWTAAGRPSPAAAAAIAQLQSATLRGLAAADYDADWLAREARRLDEGTPAERELARFDVSLTLALLHFIADSHAGRVRLAYANVPPEVRAPKFDPVAALRAALAQARVAAVIDGAEPAFPIYTRLKAALARYRLLAEQPLPLLPALSGKVKKIEPGGAYAGLAELRERLVVTGDLPAASPAPLAGRYESPLVEGVRLFQERHGLEPDGILGRQTIAELNVPLASRVRQIELSMERLRWLPPFPDGPLIAVNIPSFRLWAFDAGPSSTEPALSMRAIVGQAMRTQTPAFVGEMRYVEFNPYWNVPPSIARNEIIPRLRRDPGYFARNDMEFVGPGKDGAIGTTVDEAALAALDAGKIRLRQRPGALNALGAIKFGLPNSDDIYLHSTPAKQLFARSRRDFSHGCIRLEMAEALAQFVLRDQPEWTAARIESEMASGVQRTVRLPNPIPVVIFYTTAIADHEGRTLFAGDVYRLDQSAERALAARSAAFNAFWSQRH